jgi:hypothetical protein
MFSIERRSVPFEYLKYKSENLNDKGIILQLSTRVSEIFYNIAIVFFNTGIAAGNALKLYKLQRVEVKSINCVPQRWQIANFVVHALEYISSVNLYLIPSYIEFKHLNESLTGRKASFLEQILLRNLPVVSLINCSWETYHVAKRSIHALIDCKKLAEKKPLDAAKYSIVHAGNLVFSIVNLYQSAIFNLDIVNEILGSFNINNSAQPHYNRDDSEQPYYNRRDKLQAEYLENISNPDKRQEIEKKLKELEKDFLEFGKRRELIKNCESKLMPETLGEVEDLLKLDLSCPTHAFAFLTAANEQLTARSMPGNLELSRRNLSNPLSITLSKKFENISPNLLSTRKIFRNLQGKYHPDKNVEGDSFSVKISEAFTTLKDSASFMKNHKKYATHANA